MILLHLALIAACSAGPQDTVLPALHTLKDNDIDSVSGDDAHETITVYLKGGKTYVYSPIDWDLEDSYAEISPRVKKQMRWFAKTFTKCEVAPSFPGGESAWDAYLEAFCAKHRKEISRNGPASIYVQGIVHLKGQIVDVRLVGGGPDNAKMQELAIEAVKDAPGWVPGSQNGYRVVAYLRRMVRLE